MSNEFQQPISGSISALNGTVDITSPNSGTSIIQITGTFTGTLEIQGSNDDTNYSTIYVNNQSTKLFQDTIDSTGVYSAPTNGYQFLRIISTSWTSGSATINVFGSDTNSVVKSDTQLRGSDGTNIGNREDRLLVEAFLGDINGSRAEISNFSELKTVQRNIDIETKFYYNINTLTLNTDHANGGSASVVNRQAVLSTGTNAAGRSFIRSKETVDYRVSQDIECSNTFVFPEVTGTPGSQVGPANCKMFLGLQDENEQDYIRFGFDNGSTFLVEYGRSGTNNRILQSSFNKDRLDGTTVIDGVQSKYAPDFTKLQLIRIVFSWHGTQPFIFQIQKPDGEWVTFHVETFVNRVALSSIGIPILPLGALIENTGSTNDNILDWQAGQIAFIGDRNSRASERAFDIRVEDTSTVNQEPLLSIRSKTTYAGLTNFINAQLQFLSLSADGNRFVSFTLYRNAILTGASFADVDTTNSVMEVDTAATSFTGTDEIVTFAVGEIGQYNNNISDLDIELYPGDTITLVANTGGTTNTTAALRWIERH